MVCAFESQQAAAISALVPLRETRPFHCAAGFLHRRSPGEAAANRGFQAWVLRWRGRPPPCDRITTSPPTACLGHHCATQNPPTKKRSPEGGLTARGYCRVDEKSNSGFKLGRRYHTTRWEDK